MIHSRRPLQEKMALFWHNHFATALQQAGRATPATVQARQDARAQGRARCRGPQGQIELFRQYALGNFRDLLIAGRAGSGDARSGSTARATRKAKPQENFGREIIELFTIGVGNYVETDVYAAARVFTGWNLRGVR